MNRIVYILGITVFTITFLFSSSWAQDLMDDVQTIQTFVENEDEPADWLAISKAIQRLGDKKENTSKGLLIQILKRDKKVYIAKGCPVPGVMSPLDIIKSTLCRDHCLF